MRRENLISIAACACLIMQFAYGQQNSEAGTLKQKAIQLLSGLNEAIPVEKEDNLLRLSVDSVKKSADGYDVYMKCYNNRVQNSGTGTVMATVFIDPENYKNHYKPYTLDNEGYMNATFQTTLDGTIIIPVKFNPASKVMYVYFLGVKEPTLLRTVPLFFTIALGKEPFVVEETPRHAGTIFDEVLNK